MRGDSPILDYRNANGTAIIIRQQQREGKVQPKQGFVEPIMVGETSGYVVRGSWTQKSHGPDKELSEPTWSEDAALSVMFQRGDTWLDITAIPGNGGLDAQALVKVALSLAPYKDKE